MTTALRHRFEIRRMRSGKYAICVLDDPERGTVAIVRNEPHLQAARALMNAYWREVEWESDTRGSFADFRAPDRTVTLYDPSTGAPVELVRIPCRSLGCNGLADPEVQLCDGCVNEYERVAAGEEW